MKTYSAQQIAEIVGGELRGDAEKQVQKVAGLEEADANAVSFLANPKYMPLLETTRAGIVIAPRDTRCPEGMTLVLCEDASRGFTAVVNAMHPNYRRPNTGISAAAVIDESAAIDPAAFVGPNTTIGANVTVGSGTQIQANVSIGENVTLGRDCWIFPGVVVYDGCRIGDRCVIHAGTVIGSDGFGFLEQQAGGIRDKIPQVGIVDIGNDVEIGSNSTIDRARFDRTVIGSGTKIDNLVQIGHNVRVGENTVIVSQAGISGSTTIGNNVIIAGQVGVIGHTTIGDNAMIGAKSGVSKAVAPGSKISGYYAADHKRTMRELAAVRKLPEFIKQLKKARQ